MLSMDTERARRERALVSHTSYDKKFNLAPARLARPRMSVRYYSRRSNFGQLAFTAITFPQHIFVSANSRKASD
jgi:hypothetical protein